MSDYGDILRARIAAKQRQLQRMQSSPPLVPIGGSVDAASMVEREIRRQLTVLERLLAESRVDR
ncbi:hypothetical protein [Bradyrhizobium liaoningense]